MRRDVLVVMLLVGAAFACSAAAVAQTTQSADSTDGRRFDPTAVSVDELRLRVQPLRVEELEALQGDMLSELESHALATTDELVQRAELIAAPQRDEERLAELDERIAALLETKSDLVSRVNIVLAAVESKGGDITAARAYVSAIDSLGADESPEAAAPDEAQEPSEEERAAAAVRGRVGELIAIVRAEPPVHERPRPWEIAVSELELELQPLTLAQIEQRLASWQEILQREVRKRIRYDILLNNADKLADARALRAEAAFLAGFVDPNEREIALDVLKAELAEQSQAQQQIIRAIVERMNATIRLVQLRGGDPTEVVDYIASATGQKLNLYDPTVLYAQVRAWLFAPDGGVEIGLNILSFFAVLAAFWALSLVLAWLASAAVGRVPKSSSLLKPLLVTGVRRVTLAIGFITAISMLGVNPGPLLAVIGAAGLVIGLALQGTLSNFASGILILINRPYDVGDVIDAGGVFGKVEAMNLVSTRVLTFDNQIMLVPNNQIWNGVIKNITGRSTRRVDLVFGISYDADVNHAMRVLDEMSRAHPKVLAEPAPLIRVNEMGDNSVNLIVRPWVRTSDYWDVYWDLMRDVKLRFDEEGIGIPYPQRDIHVPGAIEVRLAKDGAPAGG